METRDRVLKFLKQHYEYRASMTPRKKRLMAA